MDQPDLSTIPAGRRAAIHALPIAAHAGARVALTTHINADGDGCGCEAALARMFAQRGIAAHIVNPTPWPRSFRFLLGEDVDDRSALGVRALDGIDQLIVVDSSDMSRLGVLADKVRSLGVPVLVIDHHQPAPEPPGKFLFTDISACATGELVFDLALALGFEMSRDIATALYIAILTDTGGFRFSNTTPRCHEIAGRLLLAGVDAEEMYRQVYASVSLGRLHLLRDALSTVAVDRDAGLTWMSIDAGAAEKYDVGSDDMDGLVEYARSVKGTRMALFFRDLGHGKVKISFRSVGEVDVNNFARTFGGGGHSRASGALLTGTLGDVVPRVVAAAREFLHSNGSQGE